MKLFRACNKPVERVVYVFEGKELHICPARFIRSEVKYYIELYRDYKDGYLPFRGTKSEQPIKLMQIFNILEAAEHRREKNRMKDI